jgi:hypothetical protein
MPDPAVALASDNKLAAHRRPTAKEQEDKGSDRTSRGETQTYLLRRLARDRPDILERVKSGEFRSARAAAIEAGTFWPAQTGQWPSPAVSANLMAS